LGDTQLNNDPLTGAAPTPDVHGDLEDLGTAIRLLASRVAELESEVARKSATVDQLRGRLAEQMGTNRATACAACESELAALRATRVFRWTQTPRDFYRRAMLIRDPEKFIRAVRARLEARR
jgi:hypothetical protein